MSYRSDNPFDGQGGEIAAGRAAMPADDVAGGIYAVGALVCIRPRHTASGSAMGGIIARCDTHEQAAEVAHRCAAFDPMLAALRAQQELLQVGLLAAPMELIQRVKRLRAQALAFGEGR